METITNQSSFKVDRPAATLRRSVTESIRNAIAAGHYQAGERVPERDLCEMTGVSRTLVREALRQLESEGLINVIAHKGPMIATITKEQAEGIYQLREVLEGLAAELFAKNADSAQRDELHQAFAKVRTAYASGDVIERLSAKNRFYECLVIGTGNEALGTSLHMLNSRAMILRGRSLQLPSRTEESLRELEQIIDALDAGDSGLAKSRAIHHVRQAAAIVMQSYNSQAD